MRIFVAVAEEEGFAAAARRLSLSAPSVTRAVAALEERIGTRLLHRTTRTVRLTEAGVRFLSDSRRILTEVEDAEESAGGLHGDLLGRLAVTASVNFGRRYVAPVVLEYLDAHPKTSVRTLFVDRVVDLVDEGLDVAVRISELADSTLTAVRVGTVRRMVCASPDYLRERGVPERPRDVTGHDTIAFVSGPAEPEWVFASSGKKVSASPPARLLVNSVDVAVNAAVNGHGLVRLLSYQVEGELKAGRLRAVLSGFEPPPLPVHVIHAGGRRASAKVRRFVDLAVARLRAAGFS
jgi:DNA-binding transcriptional LysR family regulator